MDFFKSLIDKDLGTPPTVLYDIRNPVAHVSKGPKTYVCEDLLSLARYDNKPLPNLPPDFQRPLKWVVSSVQYGVPRLLTIKVYEEVYARVKKENANEMLKTMYDKWLIKLNALDEIKFILQSTSAQQVLPQNVLGGQKRCTFYNNSRFSFESVESTYVEALLETCSQYGLIRSEVPENTKIFIEFAKNALKPMLHIMVSKEGINKAITARRDNAPDYGLLVAEVLNVKSRLDAHLAKTVLNLEQCMVLAFQEHASNFCNQVDPSALIDVDGDGVDTPYGLLDLGDHVELHRHSARKGLKALKKGILSSSNQFLMEAPLVFQRKCHATLVLAENRGDANSRSLCFVLANENRLAQVQGLEKGRDAPRVVMYTPVIKRVDSQDALSREVDPDAYEVRFEDVELVRVTCTYTGDKAKVTIEWRNVLGEHKETYTTRVHRLTDGDADGAPGSQAIVRTVLQPLVPEFGLGSGLRAAMTFGGAVFSEVCIEALPAPIWHRQEKLGMYERLLSWGGSLMRPLRGSRSTDTSDTVLREVYALYPPSSASFEGDSLTFRCYGVEHEVETNTNEHLLELQYTVGRYNPPAGQEMHGRAANGQPVQSHSCIVYRNRSAALEGEDTKLVAECITYDAVPGAQKIEKSTGWAIKEPVAFFEGKQRVGLLLRILRWSLDRFDNAYMLPSMRLSTQRDLRQYMKKLDKLVGSAKTKRALRSVLKTIEMRRALQEYMERLSARPDEVVRRVYNSFEADVRDVFLLSGKCAMEMLVKKHLSTDKHRREVRDTLSKMEMKMEGGIDACYLEKYVPPLQQVLTHLFDEKRDVSERKKSQARVHLVLYALYLSGILQNPIVSIEDMLDIFIENLPSKIDLQHQARRLEKAGKNITFFFSETASAHEDTILFQAMALLHTACAV